MSRKEMGLSYLCFGCYGLIARNNEERQRNRGYVNKTVTITEK